MKLSVVVLLLALIGASAAAAHELSEEDKDAVIARLQSENVALRSKLLSVTAVDDVEEEGDDDDDLALLENEEAGFFKKVKKGVKKVKKGVKKTVKKVKKGVKKTVKTVKEKAKELKEKAKELKKLCKLGMEVAVGPITSWASGVCRSNFGSSRCGPTSSLSLALLEEGKKKKEWEKLLLKVPCMKDFEEIASDAIDAVAGTFKDGEIRFDGEGQGYSAAIKKIMAAIDSLANDPKDKDKYERSEATKSLAKDSTDVIVQIINGGIFDEAIPVLRQWGVNSRSCGCTEWKKNKDGKRVCHDDNTKDSQHLMCTTSAAFHAGAGLLKAWIGTLNKAKLEPEEALVSLPEIFRPTKEILDRIEVNAGKYLNTVSSHIGNATKEDNNKTAVAGARFYSQFSNEFVNLGLIAVEDYRCDIKFANGTAAHADCRDEDFIEVDAASYKNYHKNKETCKPGCNKEKNEAEAAKMPKPDCTSCEIPVSGIIQRKTTAFNTLTGEKLITESANSRMILDQYNKVFKVCAVEHLGKRTNFNFDNDEGQVEYFMCIRSKEQAMYDAISKTHAIACGNPQPRDPEQQLLASAAYEEFLETETEATSAALVKASLKKTCDSGIEPHFCKCLVCSVNSLGRELSQTLFSDAEMRSFGFAAGQRCDLAIQRSCSVQIPSFDKISPSGNPLTPLEGFSAMLDMEYKRNLKGEGQTMSPFAWNFVVRRFAEFAGANGTVSEGDWAMAVQQMRALNPDETSEDRRRLNMAIPNALS